MLPNQLRILRVFGLTAADVASTLRAVRAEGCPGLRLLERDGEFAVCVQVSAPTQAMAAEYCEKWVQRLRSQFGDAVYGMGEISLAQATLDALLKKRRLIVAADEPTGRLLGALLHPLEHSEAVFDFGNQTYAYPPTAKRITTPETMLKKFPGDVVQAAAGRAQLAMTVANADCAAAYMPATVGQAPFVLLCDKRGAVACALSPDLTDAAIANNILDLARRRVRGLKMGSSTISFRPGHDRPLLIVSQEGEMGGDTTRFSLRRPRQKPASDFEPMLDFDTPAPAYQPPLVAAAAVNGRTAAPQNRYDSGLGEEDAAGLDPLRIETAGAQAAADSRARRLHVPQSHTTAGPVPTPSILDDDIPDFSAGLDPDEIAAANAADARLPKNAPGTDPNTDALQRAASRLFADLDEDEEEEPAPPVKRTPAQNRANSIKNRSLAMIEKSERRRKRNTVITLVLALLILLGVGVGVFWWVTHNIGQAPNPRSYGTAGFDADAAAYLTTAREKQGQDEVTGYLALPGMQGQLLTNATGENAALTLAGDADTGNLILRDTAGTFRTMADLATVQANSGFTLYLPNAAYPCKVMAVYYSDAAFAPEDYTDLSSYYTYLQFVLGAQSRSLFATPAENGAGGRFVTIECESGTPNVKLCVTGRVIEPAESAQLVPSAITENPAPLLTQAQYDAKGEAAPDTTTVLAQTMQNYAAASLEKPAQTSGQDPAAAPSAEGSDITAEAAALAADTDALLAQTADFLAGLQDVAGQEGAVETKIDKGAEGTIPEQTVPVQAVATPTPAPAPSAEEQTGESQGTAPEGGTSAEGETIDVTMNGTAQTLDLVQCLAMIAQNELGTNAPAEAYKAQCVAAHCWILSQGGSPSVSGTDPGETALAAAREVAHVLITYNGNVCFTPYFASASTGTASSAEVWGNDRAWLQAVDSPYDQTVSSNWNTNGNNTGCARFSRQAMQDAILNSEIGIDLSGVDPNNWFKILSANPYGWVDQMQIGPDEGPNTTCSGRWFREVLTAGQSVDGRSLRSQCFTFTYDAGLDCFIFDVYGYGHGCGMSQWGAIGYANNGWDYASILTHYFTGTTLTSY